MRARGQEVSASGESWPVPKWARVSISRLLPRAFPCTLRLPGPRLSAEARNSASTSVLLGVPRADWRGQGGEMFGPIAGTRARFRAMSATETGMRRRLAAMIAATESRLSLTRNTANRRGTLPSVEKWGALAA